MSVLDKITAQQGPAGTVRWVLGEQLKDICRAEPASAELIDKDLDLEAMNLEALAQAHKALADEKHKQLKGACVGITGEETDKMIRKFYSLGDARQEESMIKRVEGPSLDTLQGDVLDLFAFL